jgi:Transposase
MRARRSPEQWSAVLDELSGSGESVESFCRRRGLRRSTLYWWRWKLGGSKRRPGRETAIRLLPVAVSPGISIEPPAAPGIVIHVASLQVRVEPGTDVAYVASLIEAIRSRC